jgi:putative PIN family toxin of toxin-antitoxin system
LKIVLDTNILLISVSRKSRFNKILQSFLDEKFIICITDEILYEYEEILKKYFNDEFVRNTLQLIQNATNVIWINSFYKWNLIQTDPDDNKFVDCAIATGAKFLVSNDKHFNILKEISFPKVELLNIDEFMIELNTK